MAKRLKIPRTARQNNNYPFHLKLIRQWAIQASNGLNASGSFEALAVTPSEQGVSVIEL